MTKLSISADEFHSFLVRSDVHQMSVHLLGLPYSTLKELIYPYPRYKAFTITKKDGTPRIIHEPRRRLKELQEKILAYLYKAAGDIKPCVHGFTPKRSIVTNARAHCSPKTQLLLNIDIEDFFPSITFYRVRGLFQGEPFNFSYSVATVLAHICTFNGVLPQGAPTSPLIANLICRTLDRDLMRLAKRHRATYTRYADDITFSFSVRRTESLPSNICTFDSGSLLLGEELRSIFALHSFSINPHKSRLSTRLHRLEVTGITINEFPNVKRAFIDRIRGALHAWEVYGYALAQTAWENKVLTSRDLSYEKQAWRRQTRTDDIPNLKNVLWGKLLYIRMVRGRNDAIYTRLAERYNSLCEREKEKGAFVCSILPVDSVVRSKSDADNAVFVIEWTGNYKIPGGSGSVEMVGGQGTAFAYKDFGLITCNHVLTYVVDGIETDVTSSDVADIEFIIKNTSTGKSWPARIIHRDADRDLALIQFMGSLPRHPYFVGVDQPLKISAKGLLIGYPNYSPGKLANFLEAKVLSRYVRSALNRFEITGSIRQGNSGGPFVDESFRVAGVAQQGAKQDGGNDECLSIEDLDSWLSAWKASLSTKPEEEAAA